MHLAALRLSGNRLSQLLRLQHHRMLPEAQDPTLDLLDAVEMKRGQQRAVGLPGEPLAGVPCLLLDVAGHRGREADLDLNVAVALVDAERAGEVFLQVEVGRTLEAELGQLDRLDPIDLPVANGVVVGGAVRRGSGKVGPACGAGPRGSPARQRGVLASDGAEVPLGRRDLLEVPPGRRHHWKSRSASGTYWRRTARKSRSASGTYWRSRPTGKSFWRRRPDVQPGRRDLPGSPARQAGPTGGGRGGKSRPAGGRTWRRTAGGPARQAEPTHLLADEVERAAMVGQAKRVDVVTYRLGGPQRLVGDEDGPASSMATIRLSIKSAFAA